MKKVMIVLGTRPEAIKMAPLIGLLKLDAGFETTVCVTAQHRRMLDQVLELFSITPDYDLGLMKDSQSLAELSASILEKVTPVYKKVSPDLILVHGDTTTTLMASLAAFYCGIEVAHVEAGLRTGNLKAPWPEEANRRLVSTLACLHFAPTNLAKKNLLSEGVEEAKIFITGNTVIDALLLVLEKIETGPAIKKELDLRFSSLSENRKIVLVTGHRRENFGGGFSQICEAISELANQFGSVDFVFPVHLNPNVKELVHSRLGDIDNVMLLEPQGYLPFVYLMSKSELLLTDSGGIQEEAPSLGKPVIVMRDTTERPEALEAGTVLLTGVNKARIVETVSMLLTNTEMYSKMSRAHNPYGDGKSSRRILSLIGTK
jgi:UDP-N-acetylglucosamine 2-epimerase (non-hydrolysing)